MEDFGTVAAMIDLMFSQCLILYGPAVKSLWLHESDLCPCCARRPALPPQGPGERFLSVNGYFYRKRGVLIGYLLCGTCFENLMEAPAARQASMHASIEARLERAYDLANRM